jgi:hypothetical protein
MVVAELGEGVRIRKCANAREASDEEAVVGT